MLSTQPLIWKWFFILLQIKLIFTRKVLHLASFWNWGFLELGSGLLRSIPCFVDVKGGGDFHCASPTVHIITTSKVAAGDFLQVAQSKNGNKVPSCSPSFPARKMLVLKLAPVPSRKMMSLCYLFAMTTLIPGFSLLLWERTLVVAGHVAPKIWEPNIREGKKSK